MDQEEKYQDLPLRRIGRTSLGVIIPKRVLDQLGLKEEDFVRVVLKSKR